MQFLFPNNIPTTDFIYDEETFPNIYTLTLTHCATLEEWVFEISDRRNDIRELLHKMYDLNMNGSRLVGFNNIGFDYPILHLILKMGEIATAPMIYEKAMQIINTPFERRFDHVIRDKDVLVTQIDLYKIHHFDNVNRATGLKMIEINMGMDNVEDLPFPVGTVLDDTQKDVLIKYNRHDNKATWMLYNITLDAIRTRETLGKAYGMDMLNFNDTKIGKQYFIKRLEEELPGSCYDRSSGRREIRQTKRESIAIRDVIFPYVAFEQPEFQRVHNWLNMQVITETKGVFKDLTATIDGFTYVFGTGGIHGSIESAEVVSDDDYVIADWDVKSYYPNIGIANRMYPAHLSEAFCDIYQNVYDERKKHAKGTPENALFKLALNGVYGDSNNKYSPFYDPQYTMGITVNGQLMLCMLAEQLIKIPGLDMIQINTDGLTVKCPRSYKDHMDVVCKWWEQTTNLELECNIYSRMFIRDVNNYIAVYESKDGAPCPCGCGYMTGEVKRKSAYCYGDDLAIHQDHSMQVVAMAAEAELLHGVTVEEFIHECTDMTLFFMATKVPRSTNLVQRGVDGHDVPLPNIVRYVVTTDGDPMFKLMPPAGPCGAWKRANGLLQADWLRIKAEVGDAWDERIHTKNKSKYEERITAVQAGFNVTICNDVQQLRSVNINYDFYIKKARKLVDVIRGK